jgi:hypothetical protein
MSSKKDDHTATQTTTTDEECLRILNEKNKILKENNLLMKDIKEMLRKIAINTS